MKTCNLWRNWHDIDHTWASLASIIQFWAESSLQSQTPSGSHSQSGAFSKDVSFQDAAGPGHWNDPDMLLVGNEAFTADQWRVQMGMWAIFAAPLIMSMDLRRMHPTAKAILQNADVIAINQDPLGIQGRLISCPLEDDCSKAQVWVRELKGGKLAVALLNLQEHVQGRSDARSGAAGRWVSEHHSNLLHSSDQQGFQDDRVKQQRSLTSQPTVARSKDTASREQHPGTSAPAHLCASKNDLNIPRNVSCLVVDVFSSAVHESFENNTICALVQPTSILLLSITTVVQ